MSLLPTNFIHFINNVVSPLQLNDLLEYLDFSRYQCLFIKNEHSVYQYANDNYIQLMGLKNLSQLLPLSDADLSRNKADAKKYRELDESILEEGQPFEVSETITPSYNSPIEKSMRGRLYPLFVNSQRANYVLGVVAPQTKLLKLDFDTVFGLTQIELNELLVKARYKIQLGCYEIYLSKMEIRTLVQLLKGAHAGEIAQALNVKQTTIESYLSNIKNKLAVNSKSELINLLICEKILQQIIL